MSPIESYLNRVRRLIQALPEAMLERYDEQILSRTRGNLRLRLRFVDGALLEITEAAVATGLMTERLSYRYHYQDASGALVIRYDNAPHHPEVATHPDHKHTGDRIAPSARPAIEEVLSELQGLRQRPADRS